MDRTVMTSHAYVRPRLSRRALLETLGALAALGPSASNAQVDRRNAQTLWDLKRVDSHDTSGAVLVSVFHGYFPLPAHMVLDASQRPFHFVNFYRQYDDDARDGAVIVAELADMDRHQLMTWVQDAPAAPRILRYGLVIERRVHGPPTPGAPDTRSVLISDKAHFVCIVGPIEPLWEAMVEAYARLPRMS